MWTVRGKFAAAFHGSMGHIHRRLGEKSSAASGQTGPSSPVVIMCCLQSRSPNPTYAIFFFFFWKAFYIFSYVRGLKIRTK